MIPVASYVETVICSAKIKIVMEVPSWKIMTTKRLHAIHTIYSISFMTALFQICACAFQKCL
ncbi:hypothetical protein C0J52_02338 [Blattella germanica]|nr:hypothetical protein C0J52_02338 [Blattella germanica]